MTGIADATGARKPINYGIGCCFSRCRNSFDNTSPTRSYSMAIEETHDAAGKVGWVMGLDGDGQAHYACPDHAGSLFNERPLDGLFTNRQRRAIALRRSPPQTAKAEG